MIKFRLKKEEPRATVSRRPGSRASTRPHCGGSAAGQPRSPTPCRRPGWLRTRAVAQGSLSSAPIPARLFPPHTQPPLSHLSLEAPGTRQSPGLSSSRAGSPHAPPPAWGLHVARPQCPRPGRGLLLTRTKEATCALPERAPSPASVWTPHGWAVLVRNTLVSFPPRCRPSSGSICGSRHDSAFPPRQTFV